MKNGFTKVLAFLLIAGLIFSLAACGSSKEPASTATPSSSAVQEGSTQAAAPAEDPKVTEYKKLAWIMPGEENATWRSFIDSELNPKLKQDINAELDITFSPWSEYFNKIDLVLSSGQQIDIAWHGPQGVQTWYAKKAILPIDELLDKYGTDLLKVNPKEKMKHITIDGKIMAVPTNTPTSENFGTLCVRQDLLEKVGMSDLKTIEDVTAFATKLKEQNLSSNPFVITNWKPYIRGEQGSLSLDFSLLNNWFYVDESAADDKVYDYFESEAFKDFCKVTREWNKSKLIPEDFLTNQDELGRMNGGKSAIWTGAVTRDMEQQSSLTANVPEGKYQEYLLYPEKPKYIITGGSNVFVIPATSAAPEKAMMFLNWVYKSQDNYDFIVLGTKGEHYDLTENGRVKVIAKESMFYEWMFRNINYMRFPDNVSDAVVDRIKNWDNDAKYSKLFGFNFDQTPVKAEVARVQSVVTEKLYPILYGYVDYDTNIKSAVDELKNAGMDKILAELQSQFSKYYAANKQ
jgi:putative aldouronate transport system substrate-binding protein